MTPVDTPFIVFMVTLVAQWLAAYGGGFLHKRWRPLTAGDRKDFDTVQTATLTLLALIIGFSFSMAVTRYDQRKNYEEAEANAIGTAYVRADLLSPDDAVRVRDLLKAYLDQRVAFYLARDQRQLSLIDTDTAKLQSELWSAVSHPASTDRTAMAALAVSGMNDVLNSQGYTQAAWWNRIPSAAWWLMGLIAISANVLFGYGERGSAMSLLLILPIIVAIAFFLIADIDNPRGGVICVLPHNLVALSQFIKAQ